jgi:hypothetical protein
MLNAAALLRPQGMLTPGLFPEMSSDELTVFLDTKLAEGYTSADAVAGAGATKRDNIARAWAYYQAYEAIWQRVSAAPATATIDGEASRTYLQTQIETFEKLRDRYANEWSALTTVLSTSTTVISGPRSIAVPNVFGF